MDLKSELNNAQYQAVTNVDGVYLVLAGAGTGKTRVITYRIANLIQNHYVPANNILAVTFTNKAAEEMKMRVSHLIGEMEAKYLNIGTFHSICLKILQTEYNLVGLERFFGIADSDDSASFVKKAAKDIGVSFEADSGFSPKKYHGFISKYKGSRDYVNGEDIDSSNAPMLREIFQKYQEYLQEASVVDFDDMLVKVLFLFRDNPSVLKKYQNMFRYILVDEYQDTNDIQFDIIRLLAGENGNLCVVGDDDQSIYGWRGANIENILNFEKIFPNAVEIKLEDNYRSNADILTAANKLICNNKFRRGKSLQSHGEKKGKIIPISIARDNSCRLDSDAAEAEYTTDIIKRLFEEGRYYPSDVAILYRTNREALAFEKALRRKKLPYKVMGDLSFYSRREIKDIISFLQFIANPKNIVAFKRSAELYEGIGKRSIDNLVRLALENKIDIPTAFYTFQDKFIRTKKALQNYIEFITELSLEPKLIFKFDMILKELDYIEFLKNTYSADPQTVYEKICNVYELREHINMFELDNRIAKTEYYVGDFLNECVLVTVDDKDDGLSVKLMTIHASKGLEFPVVFLAGLDSDRFPLSPRNKDEYNEEEERRICYVAITRAKEYLYLLNNQKWEDKKTLIPPSMFLAEAGIEKGNMISRVMR